jgi:LysM repeat protein
VRGHEWQRYLAPAAFLLAATVAVVLIRSGLEAGGKRSQATVSVPTTHRKHIATTTTRTTTRTATTSTTPSGQQFWTVRAGDTYGVISSKSGVPIATLAKLNPKVSSTALFIGEKIRLR